MDTPAATWPSIQSKLPTVFEAIIDIFEKCPTPGTKKMSTALNQYITALSSQWVKSFGPDHVLSHSTIKKKLEKLVASYYSQVYIKCHRSSGKKKDSQASKESLRHLNAQWKKDNNVLFDIGKDMHLFNPSSDEAIFYEQQKQPNRERRVTDEVDTEFVKQHRDRLTKELEYLTETDEEMDVDEVSMPLNSTINVSMNRSGTVRLAPSVDEVATQTVDVNIERPRLRINQRVCTDAIKNTCVQLSATCGVSTEMARKCVQVVCQNLYGHQLYMNAEEQANEEGTSLYIGSSKEKDRTYVIPDPRTISVE